MQFAILGPVRVHREGEPTEVTGHLRRSLLALLLARANQPVPAEALLEALWGERPGPGGAQRLQVLVHRLRSLLEEPERLSYGPEGYRHHQQLGAHEEAQQQHSQALAIARQTHNTHLEATALNGAAEAHAAAGAATEASRCYTEALAIAAHRGAAFERA